MNIAVIGAGFSGMAAAWFLAKAGHTITIFDRKGLGGEASGIAAGLLHPFASNRKGLVWNGSLAFAKSKALLQIASDALGASVATKTAMVRPCLDDTQLEEFRKTSEEDTTTRFYENAKTLFPSLVLRPALYIPEVYIVDSKRYLEGLLKACQQYSVQLEHTNITTLTELDHFDRVIIATGAFIKELRETAHLPITQLKGQLLELKASFELPFALNSKAYLIANPSNQSTWIAGATYERNFSTLLPDPKVATAEIQEKLVAMCIEFTHLHILDCRANLRASTPNHLPLLRKLNDKHLCITGMGSRGLLYSAMMAEELVTLVASDVSESIHAFQQPY